MHERWGEVDEGRMMHDTNPFTPSFGEVPAYMAGRREAIASIVRALESPHRRPELTTIISGARGTGKTALLSLVGAKAAERGWVVASVTALEGMLDDIEIRARKGAAHLLDSTGGMRVSGIGILQVVNVSFEADRSVGGNWRSRMEYVLDALEESGSGLVIAVDEVDADLDEMVQLAAVYQHFVREGRRIALLMAGLPSSVSALVSDKTVSFLRRAKSVPLTRIDDAEIEVALRKTIREGGREAQAADLRRAAQAISGFPFLMQLVGYCAWDENPSSPVISSEDFERGIEEAREEMRVSVLEATLRDLSDGDVAFLRAMLQDEGDSETSAIGTRLGWSTSQVAQYRRRLIEAGVIGGRRRGVVGFDLPFFREFLESQA